MPPLPSVTIPVVFAPQHVKAKYTGKGKATVKQSHRGRTYDDGPLPVKPSERAPRNAQIVARIDDDGVPLYQLRIGNTNISDVRLDEILEFVSALDLETFENRHFIQEREILKVAAAEEKKEAEEERQREMVNRRTKAKTKGTVYYESLDDAESGLSNSVESTNVPTGRNGRPRPTYKHLYKLPKERRRRRRDPQTGELMPLSHDEELESSGDDPAPGSSSAQTSAVQEPLALTEKEKRPRRRRHPITKELMPLGWRYDPDEEKGEATARSRANNGPPSLEDLKIDDEPCAKRPRLAATSTSRSISPVTDQRRLEALSPSSKGASSSSHQPKVIPASPVPQKALNQDKTSINSTLEPVAPTSITRPTATVARTSITNPSAVRLGHTNHPAMAATTYDLSDNDTHDEEYDIEGILAHSMSNPKTHPPSLGKEPVMLYHVKWAGFDEPTWEPLESFGDIEIVNDYHRRHGVQSTKSHMGSGQNQEHASMEATTTLPARAGSHKVENADAKRLQTRTSLLEPSLVRDGAAAENGSLDEDEYEVERILSHHLSDPRSHPAGLGRDPIMLYQVKWKGYDEMTWEPAESFEDDPEIIGAYRKKAGLDRR